MNGIAPGFISPLSRVPIHTSKPSRSFSTMGNASSKWYESSLSPISVNSPSACSMPCCRAAPYPRIGQSTTRAPRLRAIAWLPSVEPLSETRISPSIPWSERSFLARLIQVPIVSASFRHGMSMVSSLLGIRTPFRHNGSRGCFWRRLCSNAKNVIVSVAHKQLDETSSLHSPKEVQSI